MKTKNKPSYFKYILIIIVLLIVLGISIYVFTGEDLFNTNVGGFQLRSQKWSGTITIIEDVTFAPWATLNIDPGTRVMFDKKADGELGNWIENADAFIKDHNDPTGREGYEKTHFMIYGKIVAIGTKEKYIVFTSSKNIPYLDRSDVAPDYADWDQLILFSGSHLDYVDVSYAHNGVNIDGSGVVINNSIVHDSLWSCIDIFSTGNYVDNTEVYHCWHQAIGVKVKGENRIIGNYLHDAQLAVNCENGANPQVEMNRIKSASVSEDCKNSKDNFQEEGDYDTEGGTYDGRLIYPAPK